MSFEPVDFKALFQANVDKCSYVTISNEWYVCVCIFYLTNTPNFGYLGCYTFYTMLQYTLDVLSTVLYLKMPRNERICTIDILQTAFNNYFLQFVLIYRKRKKKN